MLLASQFYPDCLWRMNLLPVLESVINIRLSEGREWDIPKPKGVLGEQHPLGKWASYREKD